MNGINKNNRINILIKKFYCPMTVVKFTFLTVALKSVFIIVVSQKPLSYFVLRTV